MFRDHIMKEAIKEAKSDHEEVPVGAIITDRLGEIVVRSSNKNRQLNDPTAHAEVIAIREICKKLGTTHLEGYSIYITLEPCLMCATAISYSRISAIYYGAKDIKFGAVESNFKVFNSKMGLYRPEIYSGICEIECADLLKQFFSKKRP